MPRILIIDDDKAVSTAARIVLMTRGYEVLSAEDGPSGIEAAKAGGFDLAIVDLFMPGMDGLEVIKSIRQVNPTLPMIAASGFMFGGACPTMPGFEAMAKEAGAIGTLYKPFRPRDVLCAVEDAIGGCKAAASHLRAV